MYTAFIHGFILALGLILPLGVQNLFVLQQGMLQPRLWQAAPAVVTAALCDTLLIMGAVGGASLVLMEMPYIRFCLVIPGSLFLFYMGWQNWHNTLTVAAEKTRAAALPASRQILFAMSVSFLNPYAFMDIIGVIGTSSLQYSGTEKLMFTGATILVSWCWFTLLSILGHLMELLPVSLYRPDILQRFSAFFMCGSGIYMLFQLL